MPQIFTEMFTIFREGSNIDDDDDRGGGEVVACPRLQTRRPLDQPGWRKGQNHHHCRRHHHHH